MTPTDVSVFVGEYSAPLVDRRAMLVPGSTEIQMYSNQQWVARFTLRSLYGEYLPSVGALVDIYEQGIRVFSGSIDETTGFRMIHGHGAVETEQTFLCVDFAARLHQRLANPPKVWPVGTPRGQVVFELMQTFAAFEFIQFVRVPGEGGFIYDGGNTEALFVADHQYLDELIQALADMDGFVWFVDPDRRLHYQAATITLAPWDMDATSNNFVSLSAVVNRGDYFNEEFRKISYEWQSPLLEQFTGNGSNRTFVLANPAGDVQRITVGGIDVPFGEPSQEALWTWEYGSKNIVQAATLDSVAQPPLTSAQTLYVYYWKLGSDHVVALATTGETAAERAAYEGNTGKYQILVEDSSEINSEVALAKAERDMTLWANILVSAEVTCHGFQGARGVHAIFPRPGMVVTIVLLYPAIDQDCLIQEVVATHVPGFGFSYTFKAYNVSRVGNVVDFFRQISGSRGGGRGGGAVSVGPPGPPGPGFVEVFAPNVSGFAVVIYEEWANSQMFGFEGDITVPVGHADYSHLKKIEVVAFLPGVESHVIETLYRGIGSFAEGATTVHYRAMMAEQIQTTTDQTWFVSFVCSNENGAPTANPFITDPQIVKRQRLLSIAATEVAGALYQDLKDGLHTVVMITPVAYTYPLEFTFWFDFDDGKGWVWQGWLRIRNAGETFRVGDAYVDSEGVKSSGHIWKPTDDSKTSWRIAAAPGAVLKDIPLPASTVFGDFTVAAVGNSAPTDITGAEFINNPATGIPQVYTLDSVGIMQWHFYKLQWLQPSMAVAPYYWYSYLTVQVGSVIAGTWTPQPGFFGSSSQPGVHEGRKMTDSGAEQGGASFEGTWIEITGGDWGIPNEFEEDGITVNPYRTYRFRIYSVSRKGSDLPGGPVPSLQNCWPGSANFFDITIPRHPDTLNLGTTNPNTLGAGMEKVPNKIQPKLAAPLTVISNAITLAGKGITEGMIADGAVHALQLANQAVELGKIAADAVTNTNISSVNISKIESIGGTKIFTGNVVLSRGPGQPVIALNNGGMGLYGAGDAGTGGTGLTSSPHVIVNNTGISVLASTSGPSVVTSGTGITIYTVNGSLSNPYVSIASVGIQLKHSFFQTDITAGEMSMAYTAGSGGVIMKLNSGGMSLTNGTYQLNVSASYIQLWSVGGNQNFPFIGVTSSNIYIGAGSYLMTIQSSTITIENTSGAKMSLSATDLTLRGGTGGGAGVAVISAGGASSFSNGSTLTTITGGDISARALTLGGEPGGHSGLKVSGSHFGSAGTLVGHLLMSYNGTQYKIQLYNL